MNWLYIIVMSYIVLSGLRGYHKGFLKVVYSMAGLLVAVLCITVTVPPVSHALKENTALSRWMKEKCETKMLTELCINALAFFVVLIIVLLILWRVGKMLDLFTKTPGIHLINMILGFIAGIVKAFLVIYVVFLLIRITSFLPSSKALIHQIRDDAVLRNLYEQNRIYELLKNLLQFVPRLKTGWQWTQFLNLSKLKIF